ncbi:STAS domain-containing protein [Roseiconus lacunae]|uniref:STAS domain-containing protein n=1 Tax=Roseiconus lacunae TaxID=2605694 RepID=UPI0030939B18|nr:STAS domain-containing protein [Stieleria sp. HD01]
MFDTYDEASRALESKSSQKIVHQGQETDEAWTFRHLAVCPRGRVIHVTFKFSNHPEHDGACDLRSEFTKLAGLLVNDSPVLVDFEGLEEFSPKCVVDLALFLRRLQSKGSRLALCNLEPAVKDSFFPNRVWGAGTLIGD